MLIPFLCIPFVEQIDGQMFLKIGLVGIIKELQLHTCNHGEPSAVLLSARDRELYYGGEKEIGREIKGREVIEHSTEQKTEK